MTTVEKIFNFLVSLNIFICAVLVGIIVVVMWR